eukprot:96157-Pelagomonas_calceolata.AAC.1
MKERVKVKQSLKASSAACKLMFLSKDIPRRHIGSYSREPPSPEGKREVSVGPMGFWQHAAPGHQIITFVFVFNGKSG